MVTRIQDVILRETMVTLRSHEDGRKLLILYFDLLHNLNLLPTQPPEPEVRFSASHCSCLFDFFAAASKESASC